MGIYRACGNKELFSVIRATHRPLYLDPDLSGKDEGHLITKYPLMQA